MEYEGERWVQGAEAQAVEVEVKVKANTLEVELESWMEDWEAVEVKMVLVEMETEQGMADALVDAIDEVQDVQGVQEEQEVQEELVELEVQDHHSRHLPPDPAALAGQEHHHQVGEHPLSRLGRPHRRGGGQIH